MHHNYPNAAKILIYQTTKSWAYLPVKLFQNTLGFVSSISGRSRISKWRRKPNIFVIFVENCVNLKEFGTAPTPAPANANEHVLTS